jgi:hypothetical protein
MSGLRSRIPEKYDEMRADECHDWEDILIKKPNR